MTTLSGEIRRNLRWIVPQILGLGLVVYFVFHLVQGDRGIRAYVQLSSELEQAEIAAAAFAAEVARERALVQRLSSGSLDLDLLEERAQAVLGYLRTEEYVIFLDR